MKVRLSSSRRDATHDRTVRSKDTDSITVKRRKTASCSVEREVCVKDFVEFLPLNESFTLEMSQLKAKRQKTTNGK